MSPPRTRGPSTRAVHDGESRVHAHDALTMPIVNTSTYVFENTSALVAYMEGRVQREEYGRYGNPTVHEFERKVAALESCDDAVAFASGMTALTTAILALVRAGSHVVLYKDCYRRSRQFVTQVLERFGVSHTLLEPCDVAGLPAALRPETRLIVTELPTNPYLNVIDLDAIVAVAGKHRVKTLVDATFATPVNLQPCQLGADLVVHSATKYLAGHNDVVAGVVAGSGALVSLIRDLRHVLGGICDPHGAYLTLRGIKTLALRVERQNATALALARALEGDARVERVWYPGLESHPSYGVARRLMKGCGGVVTYQLRSDLAGTGRYIDALTLPRIAPSLGGVESLVEQPALMSYFELSGEQRGQIGIHDALVRHAVGIEDTDDVIDDVQAALAATQP